MTFDQILDHWQTQEAQPLYGVNRDLLQLVLRREQDDLRRSQRIEMWTTYSVGVAMLVLAGLIGALLYARGATGYTAVAGLAAAATALGMAGLWISLRRQRAIERGFGNALRDEVGRNLALVEYQLSRGGRFKAAFLAALPILTGASLLYWLIAEINDNSSLVFDLSMIAFVLLSGAWTARDAARRTERELTPRRRRLTDLLATLDAAG